MIKKEVEFQSQRWWHVILAHRRQQGVYFSYNSMTVASFYLKEIGSCKGVSGHGAGKTDQPCK